MAWLLREERQQEEHLPLPTPPGGVASVRWDCLKYTVLYSSLISLFLGRIVLPVFDLSYFQNYSDCIILLKKSINVRRIYCENVTRTLVREASVTV